MDLIKFVDKFRLFGVNMESIRSLPKLNSSTDGKLNESPLQLECGATSAVRATPNGVLAHTLHRVEFYPLFGGVTLSTRELGYVFLSVLCDPFSEATTLFSSSKANNLLFVRLRVNTVDS
jgi:hypothetical protein